jgi:hypothetical protein
LSFFCYVRDVQEKFVFKNVPFFEG